MENIKGGCVLNDSDEDSSAKENESEEKDSIPMQDEKIDEKKEPDTNIDVKKVASLGLPMTESSEAWMDDLGDGFVFEDSDNEDVKLNQDCLSNNAVEFENQNLFENKNTKPDKESAKLLMTSDAWMEAFGEGEGIDESEDERETENFVQEVESTTTQKQSEDNCKPAPKSLGLPMSDTTDDWMTEDYGTINIDDDSDSDLDTFEKEKRKLKKEIEHFEKKISITEDESTFDFSLVSKEKRLSAFEEAQRFSC